MTDRVDHAIRWGFLGAGSIARSALAPAVHAAIGAELHAAAARDPARAQSLGPAVLASGSYDELIADPNVDAVYISLANDAHLPWTVAALEAGKHVLCEKPIGLDTADVRRMAEVAGVADRLLVEAFWYRWHPRTRRAEALLASGAVGKVRHVSAAYAGMLNLPGNYRMDPAMGGGALYDVGCYAVSGALWSFGWAPVRETRARRELGPTDVDLHTDATLVFDDGEADISCGIAEPERQVLVVEGDDGRLELTGQVWSSRNDASTLVVNGRVEHFPPVDPYQLMVEAVSARIRAAPAWVPPIEQSVRIAAALDSVRAAAG